MTSGNHIWDKNAFYPILNEETRVLRPANYPPECPGSGVTVLRRNGKKLGLINLQGRVFMPPIDCPFHCADALLEELRAKEGNALTSETSTRSISFFLPAGKYLNPIW